MINDKTLDEALIEIMRCKKALEALRAERKAEDVASTEAGFNGRYWARPSVKHAAAKRASLDLTRKLADLRAGR